MIARQPPSHPTARRCLRSRVRAGVGALLLGALQVAQGVPFAAFAAFLAVSTVAAVAAFALPAASARAAEHGGARAPSGAGAMAPPSYRTRLPPAAVLRYDLRRGVLSGEGELRWQHDDARYDLQLQGTVLGLELIAQRSRGGFDAAGLAPERFVDQRRGRKARVAEFARAQGLIRYSGEARPQALLAGAQDRLSWMLQLAAIVEADPQRARAGARVSMAVSGARGDSDVWTFTAGAREAIDLVGARVPDALPFRREPRKPKDTEVEVWLDPARHHLPVRMRLSNGGEDPGLLFVLVP